MIENSRQIEIDNKYSTKFSKKIWNMPWLLAKAGYKPHRRGWIRPVHKIVYDKALNRRKKLVGRFHMVEVKDGHKLHFDKYIGGTARHHSKNPDKVVTEARRLYRIWLKKD